MEEKKFSLDEANRYFGVEFNNAVFALYEVDDLSEAEKLEIVSCAHASLLHWQKFSGHKPANTQRGLYMIAKAYVKVEDKLKALEYAQKCFEFTQANKTELEDFDIAYSHEILARAGALNESKALFQMHYDILIKLVPNIAVAGDREWLEKDLAGGPWFGFKV
ncbi:MAG: hypothetical protein KDC82_05970 [Bacteroidetes bacterium]|nr:hypothetical protein [Bacteroidota bacterium]